MTIMKKTIFFLVALMAMVQLQAQDCTVNFDLNYAGAGALPARQVKQGRVMPLTDKPLPTREGYRFGGWYTSSSCQAEEEWLFGSKSGGYFQPAADSMAVEKSMTLYARWIAPTHIKDAEGLNRMREDLHGWYVLDNDIDLSDYEDWIPVGTYEADYEWADGEWWTNGFKGKLDGQGHAIRHLSITKPTHEKKALFGSMVNGEICNLIIESPRIDMTAASTYVAPLVGIIKQDNGHEAIIENVTVKDARFNLHIVGTHAAFTGITCVTVGCWNGTLRNIDVEGSIHVDITGKVGADLYIGGIAGENYSNTTDCHTKLDIKANFHEVENVGNYKGFIGGMVASGTNVDGCLAEGTIEVRGQAQTDDLYIGGLVGSGRYGVIAQNASLVNIKVENVQKAQVGGIVGEFNSLYGGIGAALGIKLTEVKQCYVGGSISATPSVVIGAISGAGQPQTLSAFGGKMDYKLGDCAYLVPQGVELADKDIPTFTCLQVPLSIDKQNLHETMQKEFSLLR